MRATLRLAVALIVLCGTLPACTRTVVVQAESSGGADGGGGGWSALGNRTVHGKNDHDVIKVGGGSGSFTKIRLEVKGSALEMYNVVIVFGNGQKHSPDTRFVFAKGEESRVIDLPGDTRNIKEIRFHYGNLPRGGKATVRAFGR